nr:hypothetical protein [Candidatus Sigynarchaeota archaeon]
MRGQFVDRIALILFSTVFLASMVIYSYESSPTSPMIDDRNRLIDHVLPIGSDLPATIQDTFSGETGSADVIAFFSNTTGITHGINVKNSWSNVSRSYNFDIKNYSRAGYSIYRADINITNNRATAQDDWFFVDGTYTLTGRDLKIPVPLSNYMMFSQIITENQRYQIKTLSIRYASSTEGEVDQSPALELWNASVGTKIPEKMHWTTNISANFAQAWENHTISNQFINASNPNDQIWHVVVNGTNWGYDPANTETFNYIRWYRRQEGTLSQDGWTRTYQTPWDDEYSRFALKYQRLYVFDGNNSNKEFSPQNLYIRANSILFDANGRASISGTNITSIAFTSNTTSCSFGVNMRLYYKKIVPAVRTFASDGGPSVSWNQTTRDLVTFPSGFLESPCINITYPSYWNIEGVYNASNLDGLSSSPLYLAYATDGTIITISGVTTNSMWQARFTNANQIQNIKVYVSEQEVNHVNVTNMVDFEVLL